jgi:hypothetical protein
MQCLSVFVHVQKMEHMRARTARGMCVSAVLSPRLSLQRVLSPKPVVAKRDHSVTGSSRSRQFLTNTVVKGATRLLSAETKIAVIDQVVHAHGVPARCFQCFVHKTISTHLLHNVIDKLRQATLNKMSKANAIRQRQCFEDALRSVLVDVVQLQRTVSESRVVSDATPQVPVVANSIKLQHD